MHGLLALTAAAACGRAPGPASPPPPEPAVRALSTDLSLDARLLIVAGSTAEPALVAVQHELDVIGSPYTVVTTADAAGAPAPMLSDGATHGLYDGIISTRCGSGAGLQGALGSALEAYAGTFAVRTACLFVQADAAYGLDAGSTVDTRGAPLRLQYTTAGQAVFGWYAAPSPVEVSGVPAVVANASDAATTPLLVDDAGHAAVAVHRFADGRELLLLTFDQAPGAPHSTQLLTGVVGWVTRGVFIGEKRAYFSPQPDDLFLGTRMRDGTLYRMTADDLHNVARWQEQVRGTAVGAGFRVTFPFNGSEVTDTDGLTQAAREIGSEFFFVSHTFDHHRLDLADYARMTEELTDDDAVMQKYAFGPYDRTSLVTPDISGLSNGPVMMAALDFGIRQVVCDATVPGCSVAVPNTGAPNQVVPGLLMIPRLATDLYADVSTPDEWLAAYNATNHAAWGRDLTMDEILEHDADVLLVYLLAGDINPVMFHQANLRAYDGTHTLLTDLVDRLLAKYEALRVLPIASLPMDEMGARMQERAAREAAGVSATIGPGPVMTVRASQAARVPITGAYAAGAEVYGAVTISRVDVPAGGEVTVPLAPPAGDDGGADAAVVAADAAHQILVSVGAPAGGCGCALPPGAPGRGAWLALGLAAVATALAAARSSAPGRRLRRFSAPRTGPDARRWWRPARARRPPS
jgi:hypothetical protein